MKLFFKEPTAPRYIYINPKTNTVHLLMPIGLDNTCKLVQPLQEFFGLAGANQQSTGLAVLTDYKEALEFDLKYMPASEEKERKAHRLSQIDTYLEILKQLQQDNQITQPLNKCSPVYPEPLKILMQASAANLHTVILRPSSPVNYSCTTPIKPTFGTKHNQSINDVGRRNYLDILQERYQRITFTHPFDNVEGSPFYTVNNSERLSLLTHSPYARILAS